MNPYQIHPDEPTSISFSGGRTSAFMLHKTIEANGGQLPDNCVVTFANTGKEMPQTLDFVKACQDNWGVDIVWLELGDYEEAGIWKSGAHEGKIRYRATTKVVDYDTASRNGEPFERLIRRRKYLPNIMSRFCTAELKVRRIRDYLNGIEKAQWTQFIGIRGDEPARAVKMHGKVDEGHELYCPMYVDGVTRHDVAAFWASQPFDLELPNYEGVTDWGNCDLCFLKGGKKKKSIIRQAPQLADWWIAMENVASELTSGTAARFRDDQPSYSDMKIIATSQHEMDFGAEFDDATIPCFCGE